MRVLPGGPPADFVSFPRSDVERSIPERFAKIVREHPDAIAVRTASRTLTYGALDAAANRVAHELLGLRGPGAEPIALLFDHGAGFVVALLGVLKAGKFYAPMDRAIPRARVEELLADLGARLLLTEDACAAIAQDLAGDALAVVNVDALPAGGRLDDPLIAPAPDDLAYVIFTSGSTGTPKGVMIDHREVLHYTRTYTNSLHYTPRDRISHVNGLTTGATGSDVYAALLNGAALHPLSLKDEGIDAVAGWLARDGITAYCSVPGVFRLWAGRLDGAERFPSLRLVRLGGDQMLRSDVELFKRHFAPGCILRNGLGAAEVLVIRHCFMDRDTELAAHAVPVGYAVDDKEVLILDEDRRPLGPGEVGEIAVKSRYMARGYWKSPELTGTRFLEAGDGSGERVYLSGDLGRIEADGCLVHLGRKDFLVKIRGKLIAPIEVENALLDLAFIKEAVVVARDDRPGESRLIAYIVLAHGRTPGDGVIRRALMGTLPAEMIPSAFVRLSTLPLLDNNKVDRRALPAPPPHRPTLDTTFIGPRTPLEGVVASIWSEVLQLDAVGVQDDFLELGGNSLLAAQVVTRLTDRLGFALPHGTALDAPTVETMAVAILAAFPLPPQTR